MEVSAKMKELLSHKSDVKAELKCQFSLAESINILFLFGLFLLYIQ